MRLVALIIKSKHHVHAYSSKWFEIRVNIWLNQKIVLPLTKLCGYASQYLCRLCGRLSLITSP